MSDEHDSAVGRGAVLYDTRDPHRRSCCSEGGRCLWHVTEVFEEMSTGEILYHIWDGTMSTAPDLSDDELDEGQKLLTDGGVEDADTVSQEEPTSITINREMYEGLRDSGFYIGEDPFGTSVHLSEDFRTVGPAKDVGDDMDCWGPIFEIEDEASQLDETETVAEPSSKKVLLRAEPRDTVQITKVHRGMRRVPEKFEVTHRTNTYHGPVIKLRPLDVDDEDVTQFELTCPGPDSHPILWRAVTDSEGFIHSRAKIAKVTVEVRNISGYDVCETCEEPIKDPMHRTLALMGECPGDWDE